MKNHPIGGCLVLWVLVIIGFLTCPVSAQDKPSSDPDSHKPRFELEEVVVTATREPETLSEIPRNVSVITSEDIAQATSNNVVDLLAREAGVSLQSFNGSDKKAAVDIRGMGSTALSNVIVVVDGVRQNASDMSGTDFSSIPLDQIERIEILRGSGAVVYGDGAVGGVINLVTKTPDDAPEKRVYASYGSYSTLDTRASMRARIKGVGINLNAAYYDTEGYRDNSDLLKKDIAAKLDYDLTDIAMVWLSGSHHEDEYGLPGPVPREDSDSRDRRTRTDRPEDGGETTDQRLSAGLRLDSERWGIITAETGLRFRNNPFIQGYLSDLSRADQTSEIDEDTLTLNLDYIKTFDLFDRSHRFQLGVDHFDTRYYREELPGGPRENSAVESLGVYITNQWRLTNSLFFNWGYRRNQVDGRFRTDHRRNFDGERFWVVESEEDRDWDNNAYDLGLTYQINPEATLFASYASSFRVPNVDELAEAEMGLGPQEGTHWDVGGRFGIGDVAELSVTAFRIRIEDEIIFIDSLNRNYLDPTIRRGLEMDIKIYPAAPIYIWANYTYTDAFFEDTDDLVPLVPEHKASLGMEWQMVESILLALTGTYVGERLDGNDSERTDFEKVDAYTVVDVKMTWTHRQAKIFVGVNNLLDALYTSNAYSQSHYPMPERNFYGGVQWTF